MRLFLCVCLAILCSSLADFEQLCAGGWLTTPAAAVCWCLPPAACHLYACSHLLFQAGTWYMDRKNEVPAGKENYYVLPVVNWHEVSSGLHEGGC